MSGSQTSHPSRLQRSPGGRSPSPLLAYLIALFAVAFALLLLSYFMQQRRSDRQLISELKEQISVLTEKVEYLEIPAKQHTHPGGTACCSASAA